MATLKNVDVNSTASASVAKGTVAQAGTGANGAVQTAALRYNSDHNELNYYVSTTPYNTFLPTPNFPRDVRRAYGAIARGDYPGASSGNPANSARDIKRYYPAAPDGVYWINLPTVGATQIYCIMNSDYAGGGWMMAMKATRGTTFSYGSSYWTSNTNTLNTSALNRNDGDAKFETFNRFEAQDLYAIFPDVPINTGFSNSLGVMTWYEPNFYNGQIYGKVYGPGVYNIPGPGGGYRGGVRATLPTVFNRTYRYFIQDADTFHGGPAYVNAWSSQVDVRFYGLNYSNNQNLARSRWGFGWNENGGGLYPNGDMSSDDVGGGIGMTGTQQGQVNYSAGDFIGCCQNRTGYNRSMRVELYVR